MLAVATVILSALVFSAAYLYFLGLRIIRHNLDDKTGAFFLALLVGTGILAATVTLEAVVLIGIARDVAGRLFYVASALGILVLVLATVGITSLPQPIRVAIAHRKAAIWGLSTGNATLLLLNVLSFSRVLPSVL